MVEHYLVRAMFTHGKQKKNDTELVKKIKQGMRNGKNRNEVQHDYCSAI